MNRATDPFLEQVSYRLGDMADIGFANKTLDMEPLVRQLFIEYETMCKSAVEDLPKADRASRGAEIQHRYFKAQKLAEEIPDEAAKKKVINRLTFIKAGATNANTGASMLRRQMEE